jgi:hypothetical protein
MVVGGGGVVLGLVVLAGGMVVRRLVMMMRRRMVVSGGVMMVLGGGVLLLFGHVRSPDWRLDGPNRCWKSASLSPSSSHTQVSCRRPSGGKEGQS